MSDESAEWGSREWVSRNTLKPKPVTAQQVARQRAIAADLDSDLDERIAKRTGVTPAGARNAAGSVTRSSPSTTLRPRSRAGVTTSQPAPPMDVDGITITRELITPEIATAMLEKNTNNRPTNQSRVLQYAADMRAGEWRENHQGIAFDVHGNARDGQHRLWAVIESGVSVYMHVARGLSEEACATIDQGRARSVRDVLRMNGRGRETQAVGWFRVIENLGGGTTRQLSQARVRELLDQYAPTVKWALEHGPKKRPFNRAPIVGAIVYAHHVRPEPIERFTSQYISGAELVEGSPVLALRTFVIERVATTREQERLVALKALRCLHAYIEGEHVEKIFASEDSLAFFRGLHAERTGE